MWRERARLTAGILAMGTLAMAGAAACSSSSSSNTENAGACAYYDADGGNPLMCIVPEIPGLTASDVQGMCQDSVWVQTCPTRNLIGCCLAPHSDGVCYYDGGSTSDKAACIAADAGAGVWSTTPLAARP